MKGNPYRGPGLGTVTVTVLYGLIGSKLRGLPSRLA